VDEACVILAPLARRDSYIGFEGAPDLKGRILEIKAETERSMAKILRTFCEIGIREYDEKGDAIFQRAATKKQKRADVK
jgi:hypothetical protein